MPTRALATTRFNILPLNLKAKISFFQVRKVRIENRCFCEGHSYISTLTKDELKGPSRTLSTSRYKIPPLNLKGKISFSTSENQNNNRCFCKDHSSISTLTKDELKGPTRTLSNSRFKILPLNLKVKLSFFQVRKNKNTNSCFCKDHSFISTLTKDELKGPTYMNIL